ncbi:tyrosine--tRNA ligase [Candidatus Uhrbacteria bacterium]|nr:tyrosine--tRNA ligase [Candidatus Uhrbacteria bacterium]
MKVTTDPIKTEALLTRRVEEVVVRESLAAKLASGRQLTVKMGFDPTAPDIHLGHSIGLRKLQEFMDLGHRAVMIIGDYTTLIGDPSGKSKTRPMLTPEEIEANAKTYLEQAGKVLDVERLEIRRNSEWFSRMDFLDILKLAGKFTVARMIEREDFRSRMASGTDIGLHELLYPMMQAYDSVMVQADAELGGTDQRFNILVGRDLQRKMGMPQQDAVFLGPILAGTDGVQKMSKSLGNYIGVSEAPEEMYGKTMSIPDSVMWDWFLAVTDVPEQEVREIREACDRGEMNPREAKARLAREIVLTYHGEAIAARAEEHFNRTVRNRELPEEIGEFVVPAGKHGLIDLLFGSGLAPSKTEARRLIQQGGIRIDGKAVGDIDTVVEIGGNPVIIQKGKRGYRRITAG